ncbi:hemagglutinin repeat-containing protein [Photobacterium toruni]|uniref:Hemagglutinin repeat-containing protein n=1 Tax=Photobacterium toruni TaxID=1935446 RepID=A0ABU6L5V6_9GAMM|nr:hemagglutinin repeat-containing protein [Photobacterium toruni]
MKIKKFTLSTSSKIAAAITITMIAVPSYAVGIVAVNGGPNVATVANGVEVINIVKPNQNGLSHNQYNQYNVNKPGAVLNNSLKAGQSQLAGQLGRNHNLQGQVASVILNEVISRNPSLLLGKQEIFGMAADYVLANPNGITCDGCGFINTNRSSLVVGNPLIENGKLDKYRIDNQNKLQINGQGLTAANVLDLIAPSVHVNGTVTADDINAISGHNLVSRDKLTVTEQKGLPHSVDSYYLGSMEAGRIRIINTNEGSGVNLEGMLHGQKLVTVDSTGNVILTGAEIKGGDVSLKGKKIHTKGKITNETTYYSSDKNYQNYRGGVDIHGKKEIQRLKRTEIVGKNISIVAADDAHLTATRVYGDNVAIQGGQVTLDSQATTQKQRDTNNNWFYSWVNNSTSTAEQTEQHATEIKASKNVHLNSTKEDVTLVGSTVKAGEKVALDSVRNVVLSGAVDKAKQETRRHLRNHTSNLITGDFHDSVEKDRLNNSELTSKGSLGINAQNNVRLQSGKAHANQDLIINAEQYVDINVQKTANKKIIKNNQTYWGGIGGGNNKNNSNKSTVSHRSEISSDGHLLISGKDGINISGSKVSGKKGGFVETKNGGLRIDNSVSTFVDTVNNRNGTAFNFTKNSEKSTQSSKIVHGSELVSDADLKILSHNNVDVVGSLVKSAGALGIDSMGAIKVAASEKVDNTNRVTTELDIEGHVKQTKDKQYSAGLHIDHKTEAEKSSSSKHIGSSIEGGKIDINAKQDVTFKGSELTTTDGDADIHGESIGFLAEQDKNTSTTTKDTINGGIHLNGGIDKVGGGLDVNFGNEKTDNNQETAVVSKTNITGNLTINADKKLIQQGTEHRVDGTYQENVQDVDHLAAINKDNTTTTKSSGGVDVGVSLDYSGISRPVESAVEKVGKGDVTEAINDISSVGTPNVGVDISANGQSSKHIDNKTTVTTTQVQAGSVAINATGKVTDQGAQYTANQGSIEINADQHSNQAVHNTQFESKQETHGSGELRVATTTGQDISLDGKGEGRNSSSVTQNYQAITGVMDANNGVSVNVNKDALYQGMDIQTDNGVVSVNASGDVKFEQATNSHSTNKTEIKANIAANGGTTPGGKSAAVGLGGSYDKTAAESNSAVAGSISAGKNVQINAGHDVNIQGLKVLAQGDTSITAGNNAHFDTAHSSNSNNEMSVSGSLNLGGGKSNSKESVGKNGSFGGALDLGFKTEAKVTNQGAVLSGNKINISAGSKADDAIHSIGTQMNANDVSLSTDKGGITLESTGNEQHKNNWNLNVKANVAGGKSFAKDDQGNVNQASGVKSHNISSGLNVGVDKLNCQTNQNAYIDAKNVKLNTDTDVTLTGAKVNADAVSGYIGGSLNVESRVDNNSATTVNIDLGAGHTNDKSTSVTAKLAKVGTEHFANKIESTLDKTVDNVANKVTDKYNSFAHKYDVKQDTAGGVTFNKANNKVTLPEKIMNAKSEKTASWDQGARKVGNGVKNALSKPAGTTGHAGFGFDVVNNSSVIEQSGIATKNGINLDVEGNTYLTGGALITDKGKVSVGSSSIHTQNVSGYNNHYGANLDIPFTVGGLTSTLVKGTVKNQPAYGASLSLKNTTIASIVNKN